MRRACLIILLLLFFCSAPLFSYESGKKPMQAMFLSLVIPGGGQFYNESYYKAAFVFALEGYFIGRTIYHHDRTNHYYDRMQETSGAEQDFYESQYNRYYRRRQNDYWWLGTTVFLSIVDAFVDAHLFNYQQEKEKVQIIFENNRIGIGINF